jgi:hypothetical protein
LVGVIQADGSAEIRANGLTADPKYAVGHVGSSSPDFYRMRGVFTPVSGKATRTETRPCEATFLRN